MIYKPLCDYTVIDLETCGFTREERMQIIELSALKYRNDELIDDFTSLVRPDIHIPSAASRVNHITDSMVESAPKIKDILPAFIEFLGDDVLVGHNMRNYDYPIIAELSYSHMGKSLKNNFVDTYFLAKRCLPELQNHKLSTLADYLGIDLDNMHRAYNDCLVTQQLYIALKALLNDEVISPNFSNKSKSSPRSYAKVSTNAVEKNPFLGKRCCVYGAFKQLTKDQIVNLFKVMGAIYIDYFCYSADMLILGSDMYTKYISGKKDDMISSFLNNKKPIISEQDFIRSAEIQFTNSIETPAFSIKGDICGKKICLTGDFEVGTREQVIDQITELGGIVKKNVIKSLDYLVIGSKGSADYKEGTLGGKYENAMRFNNNGANIAIVHEEDFFNLTESKEECLK